MKTKIVPSVDITKCKPEKNPKRIISIISNAIKQDNQVKINPVKYFSEDDEIQDLKIMPTDFVKINNVDEFSIELEKLNSEISFGLKTGKSIEVLIEDKNDAFFFIGRIAGISKEYKHTTITLLFPKTIFEIRRRDYFRFYPPEHQPIRIEFSHSEITYDFNIEDISASGFSVRIPSTMIVHFNKGEIIEDITFYFQKESLLISSTKIMRKSFIKAGEKEFLLLGFLFVNLKNNIRDKLIKNIFEEHRDYLSRMQKI